MVSRTRWIPPNLVFFVLCFIYLWLVVRSHLIYYAFGTILPDAPLFATGGIFLRESFGVPGGLAAYVAGFLSQGYYHAWLGAAIIVLAGFGLAELSRRHLARVRLPLASVAAGLPAVAFFLMYSRYRHPLTPCLAVALGLLLSLVFENLPSRHPLVRCALCCLLAAVGFWLGGGGALLVFLLLTAVYGLPAGRTNAPQAQPSAGKRDAVRNTLYRVSALPAGVAIAWALGEYVFLLPARQALLTLTPFAAGMTAGMDTALKSMMFFLYGFVPAAVLLVLVAKSAFGGRRRQRGGRSRTAGRKEDRTTAPRKRASRVLLRNAALTAIPTVLMGLGLYVTHDPLRKSYVLSNYYWHQKQWDRILKLSRRLPKNRNNVYVNHDIIRALYHTGRLAYDMFRYPQNPEAILLTHEQRESDLTLLRLSDLFLELGHVNMAEKLASELLTTKSHFGPALEMLGWISIIKGYPDTARVYLQALKRDPVYHGRAESLLRGLDDGFTPARTARIDRLRSCMRGATAGVTGREPVETLAALLEHNPHNKMAFEYLMACYLLTGRADRIVSNVDRLRDLGYPKIPTLYEEAILIHYGSQGQPVRLTGFSLSPETLNRYEEFVQLNRGMQTRNRQAMLNRLIRDFGTSYFFYYVFGRVGLVSAAAPPCDAGDPRCRTMVQPTAAESLWSRRPGPQSSNSVRKNSLAAPASIWYK